MHGLRVAGTKRDAVEWAHIVEMHIQAPVCLSPDIAPRGLKPALGGLQPPVLILQEPRPRPCEPAVSVESVDAAIAVAYLARKRPDTDQRP